MRPNEKIRQGEEMEFQAGELPARKVCSRTSCIDRKLHSADAKRSYVKTVVVNRNVDSVEIAAAPLPVKKSAGVGGSA